MNEGPAAADKPSRTRTHLGLSGKLLVLTLLFVMIAEVLIYVPSVANFRLNWLNDRLSAAYTAALVFETAPNGMVSDTVARQILESIRARAVAVKMGQQRRLLASSEVPPTITHVVDMRDMPWHRAIVDAFETLICVDSDVMRVVGPAPMGEFVEIVLDEAPLRKAMVEFSIRILLLSLLISAITAALVYLALHVLLVRPMRRMTANMVAFRADPENPGRIIAASDRLDEIGTAERELAAMQLNIATMLQQKNHLAALGLAVSKINHDLRNLLSSAQLFSERLAKISDPHVQRFAPKLMRSLERAIAFCQSTLSYGRVQEPPPDRRSIALERAHQFGRWSRTCARRSGSMPAARRCAGSARSNAAWWWTPIPTSCSASCSISCAMRCRRSRAATPAIPAAIRSALPAGARARWR
jgi:hypothetical protein